MGRYREEVYKQKRIDSYLKIFRNSSFYKNGASADNLLKGSYVYKMSTEGLMEDISNSCLYTSPRPFPEGTEVYPDCIVVRCELTPTQVVEKYGHLLTEKQLEILNKNSNEKR